VELHLAIASQAGKEKSRSGSTRSYAVVSLAFVRPVEPDPAETTSSNSTRE
jgi:hypothetical protein